MREKAVYVPLDERHCNYGYPYELGKIAGIDLIRPPIEMMSQIKKPGNIEALWEWLYQNIEGCRYAILSLDMLIYGGLLNSRQHTFTLAENCEKLNRIKRIKEINPEVEIHAFILIMRVSNYNNSSEEPEYWEKYGKKIWKYSWLYDKNNKVELDDDEKNEFISLKNMIPEEYLRDYIDRRKINFQVNTNVIDLVKEKKIDYLVIPKDDTSEYGFSTEDQSLIYEEICKKSLHNRVFIYPGTDEVGCTLVSRVLNKLKGLMPKIYVYYSSTNGAGIISKYEDRPINESIKWQILSAGGIMVDYYKDADFILMVNAPGRYMKESSQQNYIDNTYINFRNLVEFTQKIKYFTACGKRCIVADIAYSNGADNELVEIMKSEHLLDKIVGYGGWNTNANTLGVVILQGVIATALKVENIFEYPELFRFHIQKIIEDWAYQANELLYIVNTISKDIGFDCYSLNEFHDRVAAIIVSRLNTFIRNNLEREISVRKIHIKDVKLVWDRVFDVEFCLDIEF